ncbi:phosphoadenosine phosphosulfate reductase domain-containing protein [Micromonospora aurantiaca (nom. illeg.)]|uniref:phosphoadenosine phosphosulfate reductase domain-containing protein n=1 Tax=Micromonospora aurantiaca (nom. illeg.) TaxID=47850 RepID=UPI00119D1080|nr:phosphoadenosine phosphosulfate reductase family protein [Micromonospora aurantiaca]MBC9000442.1 phosphoadenosine phosphosulfate reductase family protein [Micromonospora aurantiaca]
MARATVDGCDRPCCTTKRLADIPPALTNDDWASYAPHLTKAHIRAILRRVALEALPLPPQLADDLAWFDWIIVNISGGKDSQAILDVVATEARRLGILDRVVAVHADLRDSEWDETIPLAKDWKGTADLAGRHAAAYGVRFIVVSRRTKDGKRQGLLEQIEERGMFPSSAARYCTSDQKRAPVRALITKLVDELGGPKSLGRPVRVLNVMGMRGAESCGRQKLKPFELDHGATSLTTRHVWRWLPIHSWTDEQVWDRIKASGVPYHPVYDHGLTRASCAFCVLASPCDLRKATRLWPAKAREVAALEGRIGHRLRVDLSAQQLVDELDAELAMRSA